MAKPVREGCGILFHGQISNSYLTSETRIPLFKNFFLFFGLYGIIIFISYFHASFSILLSGSLFLGSRQGSEVAGQREAPPTLQNKATSRWDKLQTMTATTMAMKKIKRQRSVCIIWVPAGIFMRPI